MNLYEVATLSSVESLGSNVYRIENRHCAFFIVTAANPDSVVTNFKGGGWGEVVAKETGCELCRLLLDCGSRSYMHLEGRVTILKGWNPTHNQESFDNAKALLRPDIQLKSLRRLELQQ